MRILCFGDSNTYGYDPRSYLGDRYDKNDRWPELLAALTDHEVVNLGCNGRAIPRQLMQLYLPQDCKTTDIFLVMLGTNDLLQGASADEAADRMSDFLDTVSPLFKQIILIAPPPMKRGAWVPTDALAEESVRLTEAYQTLAAKKQIPFIDTRRWAIGLTFDGVHFSEAGHHTFARQLAEYMKKSLLL